MDEYNKVEDLKFGEQAAVILIELLLQITEGRKDRTSLDYVLTDLINNIEYQPLDADSVRRVAAEVGEYGIERLPGFRLSKLSHEEEEDDAA